MNIIICGAGRVGFTIAKLLSEKSINVTRLARGIPMGANLEYIDDATIQRAIEGRTAL